MVWEVEDHTGHARGDELLLHVQVGLQIKWCLNHVILDSRPVFGWDRWDRWDPAPKVLGTGSKTHLKSRFWLHRILK